MTRGLVLDPTATAAAVDRPEGPPAGHLVGKLVGLRTDPYWPAWDSVTEEWAGLFSEAGIETRLHQHRPPVGAEADALLEELAKFVQSVDVAVVGLANCGSCTMWTVHDALRALDGGKSTVVVATREFVGLSRTLAARSGRSEIRLLELPFPLQGLPDEEVRQIARDNFGPLLSALDATVR